MLLEDTQLKFPVSRRPGVRSPDQSNCIVKDKWKSGPEQICYRLASVVETFLLNIYSWIVHSSWTHGDLGWETCPTI